MQSLKQFSSILIRVPPTKWSSFKLKQFSKVQLCKSLQDEILALKKSNFLQLENCNPSYCDSNNNIADELYNDFSAKETEQECELDIEMQILYCFFKSYGHFSVMKRITSIRDSLNNYNRKEISKAIEKLKKSKLIVVDGDVCYIQREGIAYFNKNSQK